MDTNGINYYKGVLLCSRPNQNPSIAKIKEFCGRVYPREQLGLVPVKEYDEHKTKKRVLPVLNNHKKWLQKFKKDLQDKKVQEEKQKEKVVQRLQKIKQEGYEQRQRQKNSTIDASTNNKEEVTSPNKKPQPNLKKKQKPAWAKTAQENEQSQQKEVDELLDFFNQQKETQLKDYVTDGDVKNILLQLKTKIQKLKEQQNWKNNQLKKIQDDKKNEQQKEMDKNDDVVSRISRQSGAQSISSQKTAQRIQQLQKKKKDVEWDKLTGTQKKTMASVDQQIAKNIADQLLRNYPNLKHHSNQSIRQLIQKHAHQQIKS